MTYLPTLSDQLHKLIGQEINTVVSTGYGKVSGTLEAVGPDYIIVGRQQGNILVTTAHIVTVWKEVQDG